MNIFQLKTIAALAMLSDHIALFFPNTPIYFHWIGRISAPIFIFCTVNSMNYTHSPKKYLSRLYLASIFMAVFQTVSQTELNFFRTLFTVAVIIFILELRYKNRRLYLKYMTFYVLYQLSACFICGYFAEHSSAVSESFFFFLLPALLGSIYTLEGGLIFILPGILFYVFWKKKLKIFFSYFFFVLTYTLLSASYVIPETLWRLRQIFPTPGYYITHGVEYILTTLIGIDITSFGGSMLFVQYQWMMLFALPALLLYNHEQGLKLKYFFYIFYPLHIILFWCVTQQ